ncbi:hypothetical protein [Xanthomonas sacchari]|uniref:hypothetical protein n=1 Tax=Xanthomonas sacchari TaxID=56458 RepID=UPI003B21C142
MSAAALLGAALVLAAAVAPAGETAAALDRVGTLRVGQVFAELAPRARWDYERGEAGVDCDYVHAGQLPKDVAMMVLDGRIARFEVTEIGPVGPFGIRIGDSEASASARLPAGASVEPHHYGGTDAHYLTWRDPQRGLAVRYETGEGTVRTMYWGSWDAVQLVEGCS